jgi:hypothetical protein
MSAGQKHREPNLFVETPKIRANLHKLLTTGHAPMLMKRWNKLDIDSDIVYLAGYNVFGTTAFLDRDFVHALHDPNYAIQLLGHPIDTGLSPDDTMECILRHEHVEKVIQDDPSNPYDLYDQHDEPGGWGPHEFATFSEHDLVKQKGGNPHQYEKGLERIIAYCEKKPLNHVPRDYACAPLLDDPDSNERRVIARLRELGVMDAFKTSKEDLDYSVSSGKDRCSSCAHWENRGDLPLLSTCQVADGLVAADKWCKKFSDVTDLPGTMKDWRNGKTDSTRPAKPAEE